MTGYKTLQRMSTDTVVILVTPKSTETPCHKQFGCSGLFISPFNLKAFVKISIKVV